MRRLIQRIRKLLSHPGFRSAPLGTILRGAALVFSVALRREPLFRIAPGAGLMKVPADFRYTSVSCYLMRDWAEIDLHFLDRLIGPGDVFIDVGANIGIYTLRAAPLVGPSGLVLAVEPGRLSADRLAANVALNPAFGPIRLVRKAVSDRVGRATFYHVDVGDDPQTFSLLTDGSHHGTEEVEVTTIDRLMADQAPGRLDCLKIDVEGVEAQVIAGAAETIARHRPIILFEVNAQIQKHRSDDKSGAFHALEAFGYAFFIRQADGGLVARESVPDGWGNLVAIHPEGRQPRA